MRRAGFPATTDFAGTSLVTMLPAPIIAPRPMVTPGRITTSVAIQHIIFDYHRQGAHDSLVALFRIVVVYNGADGGVWSDKYIVTDGYIGFIEDCEIEVACKILSDMDVEAEIAVKRRVDDKALTDTADYLVQQVGALFAA